MKTQEKILGRVYFGYALTLFAITSILVYPWAKLAAAKPEPMRAKWLHRIYRTWMGLYLPLVGCPVRRTGDQFFQQGQSYVIVINHNSLADIPVSTPWIPGPNKTLAKAEMARIPVFGAIYRAGSILVNRSDEQSKKASFRDMCDTLKKGLHLCVFPEGTRNKTDEPLQPFHDGAFVVAIRMQKPIVPALIFNTKRILPPTGPLLFAMPHPIEIHFLEPIPTKGLTLSDAPKLREQIHDHMSAYFQNRQPKQ